MSVDDRLVRSLVGQFLQAHLEPEAERLAAGLTVDAVADHVSRLLLSFFNAQGSWDLTDRDQVRELVRTQLLAGVFATS
jgi:hypothetical protein